MVDKLQSGGVQVNQIADALGGHVRIQQSGGHHTGIAVAQGAAGVEGMAQTCKSSRKSTLSGLVISIGVPGLHPDTSRRQSCAKFQRTGKLRGKGHLPDDGFIPLYQRLVRGEGWRQQRGGWHGTGTFGTQKGSFQMNTQNMRAGQFACGLLLHGGLYHRQRPVRNSGRGRSFSSGSKPWPPWQCRSTSPGVKAQTEKSAGPPPPMAVIWPSSTVTV